jgi:hypothetical protein
MTARYFTVAAPASWTKSGTTRVTVRTGGAYPVYLCIGNQRVPVGTDQAWALLAALAQAMPASYGPAPAWLPTLDAPEVHQ